MQFIPFKTPDNQKKSRWDLKRVTLTIKIYNAFCNIFCNLKKKKLLSVSKNRSTLNNASYTSSTEPEPTTIAVPSK